MTMGRRAWLVCALSLTLAPSAIAATPASGTWVGRSVKGDWVSFTVRDGYIHNFRINRDAQATGHPDLLSAKIDAGKFLGYSGTVGYHGTWCDTHHIAGLRDARAVGDPNPLRWAAHLEHSSGNPCPEESFHTPSSATVAPGDGSWSGHSKNGVGIVFTVSDGNVLNLEFGPLRIFRETPLSGGTFAYDSRRGRVVTGRFCDANHMAGLITDTRDGERYHINFSAHRNGHGQPGESPCPPESG